MRAALTLALMIVLVACGADDPGNTTTAPEGSQRFPDVIDVTVTAEPGGTYRFDVTISSPYDSVERYADAWRVLTPDGEQIAIRELLHDHANEQPFTRSLGGIEIPEGVSSVIVEGRDLVNGWGGTTVEVDVSS